MSDAQDPAAFKFEVSLKIERIELSHHRLPLDPPFHASWDPRPRRHFDATLVRVHCDGAVGVGSGDAMVGFAGYEELFVGRDPRELVRHAKVLENIAFHAGRCWPLDLALWDLVGQLESKPVWKLLGGTSGRVRAYASSGTLRDAPAMADAAERFRDQGFPALKIRFHAKDWRDEIRMLEAVRARVGDALELMVDCNQGWRMPWDTSAPWTYDDALPVARELERLGVYWMEEPLHRHDRAGMRRLRQTTDVRIAGGEMAREVDELVDLLRDDCVDVLQPDVALVGGITQLRGVVERARSQGVTFTPHTWTNGMGVVANAHLTAALADAPFLEFPYDPPEWSLERRDFMMTEPLLANTDGRIELSDAPGMGYAPNEDLLARTRL